MDRLQWLLFGCVALLCGAMAFTTAFNNHYYLEASVLQGCLGVICTVYSLDFIVQVSGVKRSDKL
jgi:hypothetical protein